MNISISSMLQSVSPSASIIISAALMLTAGFFMTRLTKLYGKNKGH